MALIAIVDNNALTIVTQYEDSAPNSAKFGNEWSNTSLFTHILMSQGDMTCYNVVAGTPPTLSLNSTNLNIWKQNQNQAALDAYSFQQNKVCDYQSDQLIAPLAETTVLMFATLDLFNYLSALQTAASIADGSLSSDGQTAKTNLTNMATTLVPALEALRTTRDNNIAAFVPPYSDASPLYP